MDHTKELTHVSLCAGYGGIDLGLRRVIPNIRTIAFSEIEAYAVANLVSKIEAGFLDAAPVWSDLKTFPFRSFRGKVDLISGGFPCQPFSAAGRRQGDEDPRHLWPYIVRGIRESSPRMVFFENVEGIISSKLKSNEWSDPEGTPVLLHVLRELERLGYRATAGVFSASEVGAPHQRKRVFIMGIRAELEDSNCSRLKSHTNTIYKKWRDMDRAGQCVQIKRGMRSNISTKTGNCCTGHDRLQRTVVKSRYSTATSGEELRTTSGHSTSRTLYPSRRGQAQYSWEPPRTTSKIKSTMGRCVDGSADWLDYAELYESADSSTDELRLLGNGVVPDTAARAFEVLWSRLGNADKYATRNESKDNVEKINQTDQARKTTFLDTATSAGGG